MIKIHLALQKYINELFHNQNNTDVEWLQNIFSKRDYYNLLKDVLDVIKKNPNMSITSLRLELFKRSGIKEVTTNFVNKTQITPGLVLDFGTYNTRDTVLCGNCQEYTMQNGILVPDPKPVEENTIFDLASTSKLFTCISILKLSDMELLDLFTPITYYAPEFKNLNDVTIYDLLKFRIMIVTDQRVDSAKNKEEAEQILFKAKKSEHQNFKRGYTDIGAMVLRYVVEKVSKVSFKEFVEQNIIIPLKMEDTYLNVPKEKLGRVANENYSTVVKADGSFITRYDNIPGTPHDSKAIAIGELEGVAPGHAGYFSTKNDMLKLGYSLIGGEILHPKTVLSISDTATGFKDEDGFTHFFGSLVYLKQPDPKNLSVYPPLSGKSFMSPGFAGTTLYVDPLNEITVFVGSNRLHNRIYQIHPSQEKSIQLDEYGKKTFILPNGEEKIICSSYTKDKDILIKLAMNLALQYQFLELISPKEKRMHLVRELN